MADPKYTWSPPEHPERTLAVPDTLPEDAWGDHVKLPEPTPVWATLHYPGLGDLRLPVFAIRRSDVAVLVQTGWQGVRQEAWVPRDGVTVRQLKARQSDRRRTDLPAGEGHRERGRT